MAYGHGKSSKTYHHRAIPLAIGELTAKKHEALKILRAECLQLRVTMAKAAFCPEPLTSRNKITVAKRLMAAQKSASLNAIYAQCCRVSIQTALAEHQKRYLSQLIGRLRHASEQITDPDSERMYFYVPIEIQKSITVVELAALQKLGEAKFDKVVSFFSDVIINNRKRGLSPNQIAVVREIHRQVHDRYAMPDFEAADSIVALPLHLPALPTSEHGIAKQLNTAADALVLEDNANAKYKFFVNIANAVPHAERINIPLAIEAISFFGLTSEKKDKGFVVDSLTLELGPVNVGVRMIVSKPISKPMPLENVTHAVVRDFGHRNTIALAVIKLEEAIDLKKLEKIQAFTKDQAREFLSSHVLTQAAHVVGKVYFSGQAFLARINNHATRIDGLRSKIDREYNLLEKQHTKLAPMLGLGEDEQIEKAHAIKHPSLRKQIGAFFTQLGRIREMKALRRELYRRIASLKKSWFGFLTNLEVGLAKTYDAVVIREDLTYVAEEKGSPGYKGRTFNRMINNGSRGQYAKRVSAKLKWNGIPEITLPSYYTSTTCFIHGIVDKKQRKGDVFTCKRCIAEGGKPEHADEHAALTLGAYLFLQPKIVSRDTQNAT
jgi:hypothetical protein